MTNEKELYGTEDGEEVHDTIAHAQRMASKTWPAGEE